MDDLDLIRDFRREVAAGDAEARAAARAWLETAMTTGSPILRVRVPANRSTVSSIPVVAMLALNRKLHNASSWVVGVALGVVVMGAISYLDQDGAVSANDPIRELSFESSPEQQLALADGEVTEDEYVFAVNATRACLTSQGVVATEPEWQNGSMFFTFGSASTREELEEANATYQACYLTHQREIDRAWARAQAETAPAPKEIADLQACYEQHGVKFTRAAQDFHEVMNVIEAQGKQRVVGNCLNGREVQIGG